MAAKVLFIGNILKTIQNNKIEYTGGIIEGAKASLASGGSPILLTNIKDEDYNKAFDPLIELGIEIIVSDNTKTTTISDEKIIEVAPQIDNATIINIKADYYYFAPTLNSDIDITVLKLVSNEVKVALSLTGFMNYQKGDEISVERFSELNENLKFIENIVFDKDQSFIQEFSNDEDHVAKRFASLGCTEVLVTYYEALFNLREDFYSRCKYVVDGNIDRDSIGDIALASYITLNNLIKEEALFYAVALACFFMDKRDITKLSRAEINQKMIEIGIV